jgi:nitronate monooxygenase
MAATVSNAGGLGSFGANDLGPEEICRVAAEIRKLTEKPFGMNLWVSTFDAGGDTLAAETYERMLGVLRPYYAELCVEPTECPTGEAPDFEEQAEALIEARPAVFSFVF